MLHKELYKILEVEGITAPEKSVLMAMAIRSNDERSCYPSLNRLVKDTALGRSTVVRALAALENKGLILVKKATGRSNNYVITSTRAVLVPERDGCQTDTATSTRAGPHQYQSGTPLVPERDPNGKVMVNRNIKENGSSLKSFFSSKYKLFKSKDVEADWQGIIDTYGYELCSDAYAVLEKDNEISIVYPNNLVKQIASIQASQHKEQQRRETKRLKLEKRNEVTPEVDKAKMNEILNNSRKKISQQG